MLIAIRESLFSCLIPSPPELEVICVKIGQSNDSIICCIYMPPESSLSYVSSVVYFLTKLSSSFSKCIFVGDFNFPDIDWSALTGSSSQSICFCNFVFDCNLAQHVSEPTHVKGNMLDLVLTSPGVAVNHVTVHPHSVVYFSDHYAICFDLNCHASTAHISIHGYTFDFSNADYESMSTFLLESDFSVIIGCTNIEFVWSYIKSLLYEAMSLYIPRILIKRRQGPKWFDNTFAASDLDKASLFNKYFHSVFTRSSFQLPPIGELETPPSSLSDISISELDVFRALRSLDVYIQG